jgi:glycerol-3-phosphate dehydrogenase subunit B
MAGGDLRPGGRFVFVGLEGLKDFYPAYLAENLGQVSAVSARAVELSPPLGREADVGSLGFARRFEEPAFRDAVVRGLAERVEQDERVGFPAVLGLRNAGDVWRELESRLERTVFEVATLPPSVSGIRLYEAMTAALRQTGGRILLGSAVVGAETENGRVKGVVTEAAARRTSHRAGSFVLASGGFAAGGIQVDSYGKIREAVFDLPLAGLPKTNGRPPFLPTYLEEQPLDRVGVAVDDRLRPTDADGSPRYENLNAAGATLAGAVPWQEASGTGLSLATGYAAADAILEGSS